MAHPVGSTLHYRKLLISAFIPFLSFMLLVSSAGATQPTQADLKTCARLLGGAAGSEGSAGPNSNWTPNLRTPEGRVELLMSVLERHPNFVASNLSFRRNVLDTFAHIPAIVERLGENAAPLEITPPQVLLVRYSAEAVVYDSARVQSFRRARIEELGKLTLLPSGDLGAQLRHLKQDKKAVKRLLRVLPFLFDSSGNAKFTEWNDATRRQLTEAIEQSGPSDWESSYFDFLHEHIDALIGAISKDKGMGEIRKFYQNTKSQFIEKKVRQVIRPVGHAQSTEGVRTLSVETVPATVAVARGCYGGDCSILSVPFFPLSKGVKVHFIRKSRELTAKPDGYILSVEVEVEPQGERSHAGPSNPKKVPYVLTANGATLTEADVRVAVDLVMRSMSSSSEVVFPDWSVNPHLVNWVSARRAMTHKRGVKVKVRLPKGWENLDDYHNLNNRTGYTNYYRRDAIENAVIGEFDPAVHIVGEVENQSLTLPGYRRPRKLEEISKLERAIVANQVFQDSGSAKEYRAVSRQELLNALKLEESDVTAAATLIAASPTQGLTLSQYRQLGKSFGFGLKEILAFELKTRAKILSSLYEESPELLTEHRARENAKVEEALVRHYGRDTYNAVVAKAWNARDLTDSQVLHLLQESLTVLGSANILHYIAFQEKLNAKLGQTSLAAEFAELLPKAYLDSIHSDAALGRGLSKGLHSQRPAARSFAREVLNQGVRLERWHERFPILSIYLEVRERFAGNFKQWMRSTEVAAARKADFLITLVGSGERVFDRYFFLVPKESLPELWRRVDDRTDLRPFLEMATQKGARGFLLENAKLESFLYVSDGLPKPGHPVTYEMGKVGLTESVILTRPIAAQATQETQIKWAIVMEENPSRFQEDGAALSFSRTFGFGRKAVKASNQPIENISWWSTIEYLNRRSVMEGREPVYDLSDTKVVSGKAEDGTLKRKGQVKVNWDAKGYRLSTEAEQELLIGGGTDTLFSFGNNIEELPLYGWSRENSGGKTHPVGELRPNRLGIHDGHGNVWEWGWDWYALFFAGKTTDPTGPEEGSHRVVRGGSCDYAADNLCSTFRSFDQPGNASGNIGFRPVRTP